jgi:hypothetical protein
MPLFHGTQSFRCFPIEKAPDGLIQKPSSFDCCSMKNFTLLSLTLLNYFSRGPYFTSPISFSPNRLTFQHSHSSRFLSSYLRSNRLLSLHISHSKFDTFISSHPIIQTDNYLDLVCDHYESVTLTGDCSRIREGDSEVNITDTYFMNLNFTFANAPVENFPTSPYYDLDEWRDFSGGCLRIKSDYLYVSNCYFYQINTHFFGGAIFSVTLHNPIFSQLIIRSHSCNISEDLPYEHVARHGPDFYGNMIRTFLLLRAESGVSSSETLVFNYSSVLDAHFHTFLGGSAFGGIALNSSSSVMVNAINLTRVNGELSNGLQFMVAQYGTFPTIQYSYFQNCSNYAFGIIVFTAISNVGPKIEFCNFVEQTSDQGLISIFQNSVGAEPPDLVVQNSIILAIGNLFVFYGGTARIRMKDVAFANPEGNLVKFTNDATPMNFTLITESDVVVNVGLDYAYRMDIGEEIGKIPKWKLTVTLAFTPSKTFSLWQAHNTPSVFANSTSGVSAGVLATIFGILSLIVFLFLLYVRRGSAVTYKLIGRFSQNLEFDGVAPAVAYDNDVAEYEYTYSVSYEYSYASENGEDIPTKGGSDS